MRRKIVSNKNLKKNYKIRNNDLLIVRSQEPGILLSEINKVITKEISEIANNSYSKKIDIKINTNYVRTVLAKNTKGTATDFQLKATSRFELTNLDKAKNFTIEEKFNYKKMSNNYEQNNYEKTIKKNLASLITRKLILRLKIAE